MNMVNRGRYHVRLSPTEWTKYAEPMHGLRMLGVIERGGRLDALAVDGQGCYFAVFGRRKMPLVQRKVEMAMEAFNGLLSDD